jgi:hypothetical protein
MRPRPPNVKREVSPLDGFRNHAGGALVSYVSADPLQPEDATTIAAADAAIVVVGRTHAEEGEGIDVATSISPLIKSS